MIKQEIRDLTTYDGYGRASSILFGPHVLTWAKAPWGWVLIHMEPLGEAA